MPSIPQSLLWISLVVLWLFVLVPMLISKRDAVRRTSDVALATRVLNGGAGSRLLRRNGPAAGHASDPDWQPEDSDHHDVEAADHDEEVDADERPTHPVLVKFEVPEQAETDVLDVLDVLDVDVIEDSAALPAGVSAAATEPVLEVSGDAEPETEPQKAEHDDEYEYVDDSSGLEAEEDDDAYDDAPAPAAPAASRRRRFDNETAAAVTARKYTFRKRVLMVMAVVLVSSATAAFEVTPAAWWVCSIATTITVLYLAYLRRQTRIEEKLRRRRMHRMARARLGVENAADREYDVVPSRLRRPGAVVLEIDDEDPIFEHLDYDVPVRAYGWPRDLPRAVGA